MINDIEYLRKIGMLVYKLEKNVINIDEEYRQEIIDFLYNYRSVLSELDDIQKTMHNTKLGIDRISKYLGSDNNVKD